MERNLISVFLVALLSCSGSPGEPVHTGGTPAGTGEPEPRGEDREPIDIEPVEVELFLMSRCPYGSQVIEGFHEVALDLGAYMDLSLDFIGKQNPDGSFDCLHGPEECQGNMILLCAGKHAPDHQLALAACMAGDFKGIPGNLESCAGDVGLDPGPVQACVGGGEGAGLLAGSFEHSADMNAKGSPTIYIGGERYDAGRSGTALAHALCQHIDEGQRPVACPTPEPVQLTVVSDARCSDCEDKAQKMIQSLEKSVIVLEVTWLDWADQAGQDLASQVGAVFLPTYVFQPGVANNPGWDFLVPHLTQKGDLWVLDADKSRSSHDPTLEVCDNAIDDTGDGKVDCDDPDCTFAKACREDCTNGVDDTGNGKKDCKDPGCKGHKACLEDCTNGTDDNGNKKVDCKDPHCDEDLACRKEHKGRLDLFMMSDCNYCDKAVDALLDLDEPVAEAMKVTVHFVMSGLDGYGYADYQNKSRCEKYPDGFWYCSLHGPEEVRENLRRLCIQALYPDEILAYMACEVTSKPWEDCAKELGLVPPKVEKCMTGKKGAKLMQKNAKLIFKTGINKSPSFLWNNTTIDHPKYTPASITEKFCSYNPGAKPCK